MASGKAMMRSRGRIKLDPSKRGSLHSALGVPQGEKIPIALIRARKKTASGNLKKKLTFADNAKTKFRK